MNKFRKGFTLVEILVIVGIIALLAAIAIPNLMRSKVSANEASAQATLKVIAGALENYAIINSVYPIDPNDLLGITPPYLNQNFFTGTHAGFTFTHSLAAYTYSVYAHPINPNAGTRSYTISTGSTLQAN